MFEPEGRLEHALSTAVQFCSNILAGLGCSSAERQAIYQAYPESCSTVLGFARDMPPKLEVLPPSWTKGQANRRVWEMRISAVISENGFSMKCANLAWLRDDALRRLGLIT